MCIRDRYIESQKIFVTERETTIHEERLGTYTAVAFDIKIGNIFLKLEPVATYLIGAKGRFDLIGPGGTSVFLLVPEQSTEPKIEVSIKNSSDPKPIGKPKFVVEKWKWKLLDTTSGYAYTEIDVDSLSTAMMNAANG